MNLWKTTMALAVLAAAAAGAADVTDYTKESDGDRAARMKWFADARFGMFIHWGVYSVPAGEYKDQKDHAEWYLETTHMPVSEYEKFATQFNPVKFDAGEWARLAKQAGMKYMVITSKHHDGFGLWDSQLGDWDIGRSPFKRDPLKELAAACAKEGIVFCFYHSIMDWHHPDWGHRRAWNDVATGTPDMDRYVAYMKGQLKELLTGYGPIGILWFDGQWESAWTTERGLDLYNYVRSLQPSVIVNNRVGKPRHTAGGGMANVDEVGDYGTPEQTIPGKAPDKPWESCMTMNDHWGFNKFDHNWKSTTQLIRNLVDCASKGGNYLLNIGPTAEGLFPAESVERLQQIGAWMKVNGEAIHGTTVSPFRRLAFGRATTRGATLYLHVFDWPADRVLRLPGLRTRVRGARFLADAAKTPLAVASDAGGATVTVPDPLPVPADPHATVIAVELDGPAQALSVFAPDAQGVLVLAASDADITGEGPAVYENGGGKDNIGVWTSEKNIVEWPVHMPKAGRYAVTIEYACEKGSEGSEFELALGAAKATGRIESTGTWTTFVKLDLSPLDVAAGPATLVVKPLKKPGLAVMNLKSVVLKPVE